MAHAIPTTQTDVAIIGAGTAGMAAYRAALRHTERVVLIESQVYGTTCARVGCMPSKLLIAAAEVAHSARHASRFGVNLPRIDIDGRAVMERVRSERDRFVGFVVDTVEQWPAAHRWQGHARFVDTHTLAFDGPAGPRRLQAERIVIATGSRPAVPPAWRATLGDRLIVNDDVFSWTDLPESVAVVGAGVVGLELAQALHRLGVRVRLFGRGSRIGPLTHPALQALAREVFGGELPLTLEAQDLQPRREGDAVVLRSVLADGAVHEERFEYLLAATGRRPNVDRLGLEHTALPLDPHGVPVVDRRTGQIGSSAVFMAGDAADDRPLLHEAADEGRIAGDNAGRWPDVRLRPRRAPLAVVFNEPQMALAGATHAELVASGADFEIGEVSFADQGRSRVMGRNQGALQVYAERGSGRLLGAEMIGPAAEHLGHLLAWSVQRGDTVQQMLDSPFYHPVVEEGLRTALRHAQRALQLAAPAPENCLECHT
jgi:dihydrolipoamide dehydrogenase